MNLEGVVRDWVDQVATRRVTARVGTAESIDRAVSQGLGQDTLKLSPAVLAHRALMASNQADGAAREVLVHQELRRLYPKQSGFSIVPQATLRDKSGAIVKDELTHESRRIDFVVLKKHHFVRSIEVTSRTAPKGPQLGKELRIRSEGGSYIKHPRTGELIYFPARIKTEVWRRD